MTAVQLELFAPKAAATCPRFVGRAICSSAREQLGACPGAKACEGWPNADCGTPKPPENDRRCEICGRTWGVARYEGRFGGPAGLLCWTCAKPMLPRDS